MSALHLDNRLVHYEVVGKRGQPIIFLHSWLGSWRYWLPTMDHISERYRAYALDFWGFGESDRNESDYSLSTYVTMICRFMDHLGITKVNLAGHGLGGMVAIRAASLHPDRFNKIIVSNTPIDGVQLQEIVRPGALSRLFGRSNPTNIWARLIRQFEMDDPEIHKEIIEDTESLSEKLVQQVITAILETDLRQDLAKLEAPLLGIYGERDSLVSHTHADFLQEDYKHLQQKIKIPKAHHFPFLDHTNVFNRLTMDFLNSSSDDKVAIKEEWRRRVSQLEYI
ncbi:MAG: alpha/beta hydrolase [Chloroflexi bacterium AL-W]|nr:alpha/beta hydrolase [Chloroflexi bacterium AL-N1]NOK65669.1 alpha/beta hydrolase [Chloroflexi bacterium AL-N10]NOK74390.1 alpha/beta hydrolase [Chloroflexi bacterium AL-N5]NOK80702.1 alpha/beta hydrolase [Chloroflexi bacterium AL-W]NOK88648.1 alpha/beta hydrolase [Chloroflexi bacterium AL-N15]